MAKVNKSWLAERDLNDIWDFIAESDEAQADKFIDLLFEKSELLAKFPEMGRTRHEFLINLRSFPVKNYLIFYLPVENGIEVLRVLHASRDISNVFDEMIDETKKIN
ncbi:MAG: type II toxin-antitoxin system RelE/ParE family toxin [Pyrinomonadaceae bacterium]